MSKSNAFETALLQLIFNATAIANIADNAVSSPATTLTIALHTADPGEAGNMSTNEAAYTGYARQTVARNSGGFTVSGNSVSFASNVTFPECGGGTQTITHFSVGTGVSNNILYKGTVTPNISVSSGVTPRLKTTSTITED